jgi:hypothetical protein
MTALGKKSLVAVRRMAALAAPAVMEQLAAWCGSPAARCRQPDRHLPRVWPSPKELQKPGFLRRPEQPHAKPGSTDRRSGQGWCTVPRRQRRQLFTLMHQLPQNYLPTVNRPTALFQPFFHAADSAGTHALRCMKPAFIQR